MQRPGTSRRIRFVLPFLEGRVKTNAAQGVYIYQGERPSKRRKVAPTDHPHSDSHCFVPLLNGEEPPDCVQLRYDTYKKLWSEQERSIQVSWRNWRANRGSMLMFTRKSWTKSTPEF